MDLAPLTQLLRDFHSILSVADDFQPFDYDTAEESNIAAGMPGNEAPPVRRASRSPEQTKQLLLADIERLRERLQARVDALTKQAKYVCMRVLSAGCGARGVRLTHFSPTATRTPPRRRPPIPRRCGVPRTMCPRSRRTRRPRPIRRERTSCGRGPRRSALPPGWRAGPATSSSSSSRICKPSSSDFSRTFHTTNDQRPNHTKDFACLWCAADSLSTLVQQVSAACVLCVPAA